MASYLDRDLDIYDNTRKFAVTNWSDSDVTAVWGGEPFTIKAGEVGEYPMYLAYHITKYFVDREMIKTGQDNIMNLPQVRKPLEDKTLTEIRPGEESPAITAMRDKMRKEVMAEMEAKKDGDEDEVSDTPVEEVEEPETAKKKTKVAVKAPAGKKVKEEEFKGIE